MLPIRPRHWNRLSALAVLLACWPAAQAQAQETPPELTPKADGKGPFSRSWYAERDIDLPRVFGAGLTAIFMERDISVSDVTVAVGGLPPVSVSDRAGFEVSNQTTLTMVRLDGWALPFLDLYAMVGQTRTESSLVVSTEIGLPGGGTAPIQISRDQDVDGPLLGGGATLVFGGDAWFAMADANYSRSDLDLFDGEIAAWFLSGRLGWHRTVGGRQFQAWGGLAYLDSTRTLQISLEAPIVGRVRVEVEQEPVNPWSLEMGGSFSLNRRWHFMAEVGSNFEDVFLTVLAATVRF